MIIKLIKPYKVQNDIITAFNTKGVRVVVCCMGRGAGKSILLENIAIEKCINNNNLKILIVSPTESQNLKIYTDIVSAVEKSGIIKSNKQQSGACEIIFNNNSKIMFRSGLSESARGIRSDILILDEAARIPKTIVDSVFIPTLAGSKIGKMLVCSTPKGNNWFKNYYDRGFIAPSFRSFRCNSYDSPYMTPEIIDTFRESLPEKLFQQEIEAKFVDGSSIFNNLDESMVLDELKGPNTGELYWAGIDIGLINDATVLSIIDSKGNLVKYYRWENIESPQLIREIIKINELWKFKKIMIENNNQGLVIFQELKIVLDNIIDFNTNQSTKPDLINRLIHLFNMKEIKLIKDEYLRIELDGFIFKQGDTGKIKFMADNGFHDDCVMSLAIAVKCYESNKNRGIYKFY